MTNKASINARDLSMLELRHLRYFLALATHLHFAKAARSVNVTQPSLSRQITALEEELGCLLFMRTSRSVTLTAAGQELQRNAHTIVHSLDAAVRSTQAVARGERGELRIAFSSMIAWTAFPSLLKRYANLFPQVALGLTERLPLELIRSVETGETDVCLTFKTDVQAPLQYRHLYSEKLCIALPADHALARQPGGARLGQLKDEPFIMTPQSTAPVLHDMVMGLCRMAGFLPVVRMHSYLQGTIINLVAEGLGVSVVPAAMAEAGRHGVVFVPIPDSPVMELGIVWSGDNQNPCLPGFLFPPHGSFPRR